jgi:hypothetical protein
MMARQKQGIARRLRVAFGWGLAMAVVAVAGSCGGQTSTPSAVPTALPTAPATSTPTVAPTATSAELAGGTWPCQPRSEDLVFCNDGPTGHYWDSPFCATWIPGALICWEGRYSLDTTNPTNVESLRQVSALTVGPGHACGLSRGTVLCVGDNARGQVGDGTLRYRAAPARVSGIDSAVAISAGGSEWRFGFSCAVLSAGTVKCWGDNSYGTLGNGGTARRSTPVSAQGLKDAVAISAGGQHACALLRGGTVKCWGDNEYGQLGDGTYKASSKPVTVAGLRGATAIFAGLSSTCAILAGGAIECWGHSPAPLLEGESSAVPVLVPGIDEAIALSFGGGNACALLLDKTVKCWGPAYHKPGCESPASALPVPIIAGATAISFGGSEAVLHARFEFGGVKSWAPAWSPSWVPVWSEATPEC